MSIAFQDWPVSSIEVFEDNTNGVAGLADANSLQHTCAPELLQHIIAVEVCRRELIVRLDAADVPWR